MKHLKTISPIRQIKFRAWEPEQKEMFGDQEAKSWLCFGDEKVIYMQSIEMLDIHFKELYEGDIIKLKIGRPRKEHIGLIRWARGGFIVDLGGSDWCEIPIESDFEIMGNCFENKDLLDLCIKEQGAFLLFFCIGQPETRKGNTALRKYHVIKSVCSHPKKYRLYDSFGFEMCSKCGKLL